MDHNKRTSLYLFALITLCFGTHVVAYTWPSSSPQYDTLEQLLYEGHLHNGRQMSSLFGCSMNNNLPNQTTIAATWLRAAYHGAATFNITDKTGGLDASLFYELDRAENIGMDRVVDDFSAMPNKYLSKADIIALGAVLGIADCGGPAVLMSAGRIDAKKAGRFGVPEPHQDLRDHTEKFRIQGFNATEMIELIACGHTMGGVDSQDFPKIVRPPKGDNSPFPIVATFDTTKQFDNSIVTEYLDGTSVNRLLVGSNATILSDKRIFGSDNNATMKRRPILMSIELDAQLSFERMLDNVPGDAPMSPKVELIPEKPQHAGLRIINGTLTFFTTLRMARPQNEPFLDAARVSMFWCDRYGDNADCRNGSANKLQGASSSSHDINVRSQVMIVLEKDFRLYHFQAPINPSLSVSRFWWEADDNGTIVYDNGGEKYPLLHDDIIHVSVFNHLSVAQDPLGPGAVIVTNQTGQPVFTHFVVAGVRDGITPDRLYANILDYTYTTKDIDHFLNITVDFVKNTTLQGAPGYTLYSATFETVDCIGPTMDLYVDAGNTTYILDFQAIRAPMLDDPTDPHADVPLGTPLSVKLATSPNNGSNGTGTKDGGALSVALSSIQFIVPITVLAFFL